MKVGTKIKNYLKEINMSQVELSILTGITTSKINLILTGKRKLSIEEYEIICGVLKVGVEKFITPKYPDFLQPKEKHA